MYYLDNAATTKVSDDVIQTVTQTLTNCFGNPSSLHKLGLQSEQVIKKSRTVLAKALGCLDKEVYFTSSGTESNNIALIGAVEARRRWADNIVCTGFEHSSVIKPLESLGLEVRVVNPDKTGNIDISELIKKVDSKTAIVSVMQVNNEIGTVQDVVKIAQLVKEKNPRTAVHIDGIQGFLKIPFTLKNTKIDSYSLSGHKIHAPKGIGALYLRSGHNITPPFLGGGQEQGVRSGTENIAYIAGLATAVETLYPTVKSRLREANEICGFLRDELSKIDGVVINSPENISPYNYNFSCLNIRSEVMLHHLEISEVYVSSGSACSKGKGSHTLNAMGLDRKVIDSSLRISICKDTTKHDIEALITALKTGINTLSR